MKIVVVESHQHVLEHIHSELRKNFRKCRASTHANCLNMIHLDAHPDLACPGVHIPAVACFEPRRNWPSRRQENDQSNGNLNKNNDESTEDRNLYELLDSTAGGIAEWILPLCLGAGLKKVYWVRSPWSEQFFDGNYSFHVGASFNNTTDAKATITSYTDLPEDAVVKVDLPHRYYIDDGSVVPFTELFLPTKIDLTVSLIDEISPVPKPLSSNYVSNKANEKIKSSMSQSKGTAKTGSSSIRKRKKPVSDEEISLSCDKVMSDETPETPWILDVCLDYFACLNPFLSELESIDEGFTRTLTQIIHESRFYTASKTLFQSNHDLNKKDGSDSMEFFRIMELLLLSFIEIDDSTKRNIHLEPNHHEKFINFFASPSVGKKLIEKLRDDFEVTRITSDKEVASKLILLAVQALRNISMPHNKTSVNESLAIERVRQMGNSIRLWKNEAIKIKNQKEDGSHSISQFPFCEENPVLITIARSSLDGFMPESLVETVQHAVLSELHSIYCDCGVKDFEIPSKKNSSCRCRILFDYGDWEGSIFDD